MKSVKRMNTKAMDAGLNEMISLHQHRKMSDQEAKVSSMR